MNKIEGGRKWNAWDERRAFIPIRNDNFVNDVVFWFKQIARFERAYRSK